MLTVSQGTTRLRPRRARALFHLLRTLSTASPSQPKSKYDVVIVGGGHNGIVAAGYLAKAGASVCVLERRHVLGGASITEEIVPGFKFSRASYLLSLLRPQIYEDFKLKENGLKIYLRDPTAYTPIREQYRPNPNAKSLTLGRDGAKNTAELAKFSKKDAEIFPVYKEQLIRLVMALEPLLDISPHSVTEMLDKPSLWGKAMSALGSASNLSDIAVQILKLGKDIRPLYEFMTASPHHILSRWFETQPLQTTLATDSLIGTMASPYSPGIGYVLLHHVMGGVEGIRAAWAYPEGGMGAVSDALAKASKGMGAEMYTNQTVASIKTDGSKKAVGVVTTDGREIDAQLVLSNATPAVTLSLLPEGTLSDYDYKAIKKINYDSPVTKINVALSRVPNFTADPNTNNGKDVMPHHQCGIHINCENCDMVDEAYRSAKKGLLPQRPMIKMMIPSSLDPTIAPKDAHVCLLFTQFTPYHLSGGRVWNDEVREEYANIVFDCIEEYAPGFKSSVIGKEVLAPPDLEEIFGLTGGNIFHGSLSVDQLFLNRPLSSGSASPFSPVNGLLLCGSGAHPGGGVTGAPGRLAAQQAIAALKL